MGRVIVDQGQYSLRALIVTMGIGSMHQMLLQLLLSNRVLARPVLVRGKFTV